jgi:hypothetical protein
VQQRDPQFQCMDQTCVYYGKLLCNTCIVEEPVLGDQTRQELVKEGKEIQVVPTTLVVLAFCLIFGAGLWAGAQVGFVYGGFFVGMFFAVYVCDWLYNWTYYEQPSYRTVTENIEVGRRKCCIACRHAVQNL